MQMSRRVAKKIFDHMSEYRERMTRRHVRKHARNLVAVLRVFQDTGGDPTEVQARMDAARKPEAIHAAWDAAQLAFRERWLKPAKARMRRLRGPRGDDPCFDGCVHDNDIGGDPDGK